MSYHPFEQDGHRCPTCGRGPFACGMEDGQCDNNEQCSTCVVAAYERTMDRRREYGMEDQPYDW